MIPASRKAYRGNQDLADREWITSRYFICGVDVDPEINLIEGYVSFWTSVKRKIMVKSFYCPDDKQFYFDWIDSPDIDDLEEILDDLSDDDLEGFMDYLGTNITQYKRFLFSNAGKCIIVNDLSSYFGYPIDFRKNQVETADNFVDVMRVIEKILVRSG